MIVETEIDRLESESFADIEATLEGRVFDVTLREFFSRILVAGVIVPNQDGALPTTFGSSANSFFRNRGCVSVFDFRGQSRTKSKTSDGAAGHFDQLYRGAEA